MLGWSLVASTYRGKDRLRGSQSVIGCAGLCGKTFAETLLKTPSKHLTLLHCTARDLIHATAKESRRGKTPRPTSFAPAQKSPQTAYLFKVIFKQLLQPESAEKAHVYGADMDNDSAFLVQHRLTSLRDHVGGDCARAGTSSSCCCSCA